MRIALKSLHRHFKRHFLRRHERQDPSGPVGAGTFARQLGIDPRNLAGVILEVEELRPIVEAIRATTAGSLLVFGCGNDSVFWEQINKGGHTAFIEDDSGWARRVGALLKHAQVHLVKYETRRQSWREYLDDEGKLQMELPTEVTGRQWDVIIVDAPAGYNDEMPGRMKSIYAASRLASPGTRVFVHDCERPVEDAFTSRYLGAHRMFLERRGHAILRGYSF